MHRSFVSIILLSALALFTSAAVHAEAPGFPRTVIFATNSVFLEQGSEVVSGHVIVNDASPGPTLASQKELTVGLNVTTPAGFDLKADSIRVRQSAVVGGAVYCNDLDDGSGNVTCEPLSPLPVFTTLPAFSTGPSDGPDVFVGQAEILDLGPGTYGLLDVRSGGIVRFSGGEYNLREIDTGTSVTLIFLAPSTIHVAEKLRVEQGSFVGPDPVSGLLASDVVFYVAGINGGNGNLGATPKAAHLGLHCTVLANFYVPNGTLWLRQGTAATGAFLARDVDVGLGVLVTLESAFNQPPAAADDSATVVRSGTVSLLDGGAASVLANDTDPESGSLTASLLTGPANASSFVLHPDGTFSYTHNGGEATSDGFVYQACDDGVPSSCDSAAVAITILQEAPTTFADPQSVATAVDTPVVITLTGEAAEEDLPLTFTIVADPAHGFVTKPPTTESPTSARTTYVPEEGFTGTDSFTFQVEDAQGVTATAVVTVTVSDESGSADVEAVNLSVSTDQETPVNVTLRGSTTLEETLAFAIATPPVHGTLGPLSPVAGDPNAQLVTYTPATGFSGTDSFTYEVCVSSGCATGTVTITVRPTAVVVTVTKAGDGSGQVSSQPAGIDCGIVCSAGFGGESPITLFAVADEGSVFSGWSGDADCLDGQLTPDADKSCTATFALETPPDGDVLVTVGIAGTGNGRVVSDPAGIDCGSVCQATFPSFQRILLNAIADPGSRFVAWSGSGDCLDGELAASTDVTCVAVFDLVPTDTATLTVTLAGNGGGSVSSNPAAIQCPGTCEASFASGTLVRLFARADDSSFFDSWSGDCVADEEFPFVATVTVDAAKTCTATFLQ